MYKKYKIPLFNITFIRWDPRAITNIHSHPKCESNIYVIRGKFQENIYKPLNDGGFYMTKSKLIDENQCSHINDSIGYHTMRNISDSHSWTVTYVASRID